MKFSSCAMIAVALLLAVSRSADAQDCQNLAYAQCGGTAFTGDSCCPTSTVCIEDSSDYSQCKPDPALATAAGNTTDTGTLISTDAANATLATDPAVTSTNTTVMPIATDTTVSPTDNTTTPTDTTAVPTDTAVTPTDTTTMPADNTTMPTDTTTMPTDTTTMPADTTTTPTDTTTMPTDTTVTPTVPAGVSPFPACAPEQTGLDYAGNDLAEITGASLNDCGSICAAVIQCAAISYLKNGKCYLKMAAALDLPPAPTGYTAASYDLSACDVAFKTIDAADPTMVASFAALYPGVTYTSGPDIVAAPIDTATDTTATDATATDAAATNTTMEFDPMAANATAADGTTVADGTTTTDGTSTTTTAESTPTGSSTTTSDSTITPLTTSSTRAVPTTPPASSGFAVKMAAVMVALVAAALFV